MRKVSLFTAVFLAVLAYASSARAGYWDWCWSQYTNSYYRCYRYDVFDLVRFKLLELFNNIKHIIFIVACFAFIGFAINGMMGKLDWKKVAFLAIGLFLLVISGEIIRYFVTTPTIGG